MDRLLSLRKSEANSVLSNTSLSSELGYETAQDDSSCSLYYSMDDDTLTDVGDISPNSPGHPQVVVVPDAVSSSQTNQISDVSIGASVCTESSTKILIEQPTDQLIIASSLDVVPESSATKTVIAEPIQPMDHLYQEPIIAFGLGVDSSIETGPLTSSMNREIIPHQIDTMDAISTAQNFIFNLPPGPSALSSNDIANFAYGSSIVQELYVETVAQQRTNRAPELSRGM